MTTFGVVLGQVALGMRSPGSAARARQQLLQMCWAGMVIAPHG